jgi:tetratricopeptide (TPR) repeat protein
MTLLAKKLRISRSAYAFRGTLQIFLCCALVLTSLISASWAQPAGDLPSARYYASRELFRMGNVLDAKSGFQDVLTRAQRSATDGWIDSVPTMVMLAECHYHQGELAPALQLYDGALEIVEKFPGWLDQFDLGDHGMVVSDATVKGVNWFKPSHSSTSLSLPPSVQMNLDLTQAIADNQGNVIAPLNVVARLDSTEVLRTIAVALIRRWQLLGPLTKYSPLTARMSKYFSNNTRQQLVWAQSSWLVLRGLANLSQDETLAAQQLLSVAYLNNRQYDYFMTPIVLQTLGEIAARRGQYQAAIVHFQDASLLAAQFLQYDQLSEALISIGDCGAANDRVDLLDPLIAASAWCGKRSALGHVAGLSSSTELCLRAGRLPQARKLIAQEASLLKPSKGAFPRFQARLAYNEAILGFAEGQPLAGWARTNEAINLMRGSAASGAIPSVVFQQQLTLDLLAGGNLTLSDGDKILEQLLAEPSKTDWELRPLETLAALATAVVPAYQRWLKLANPADRETTIARLNMVQARQVHEALPLGGRLLAWKKAVSTPFGELPPDVRPVVQAAVQQTPALDQLAQQLVTATDAVRSLPLQLDERQIKTDQKQMYVNMEETAERLETQLMLQALSRRAIPRFVPGEWNTELVQRRLADGDVLIGFVEAGEDLVGVAITNDATHTWRVPDSASLAARINIIYQQIGLIRNSSNKLTTKVTDPNALWRTTSAELYSQLFAVDPAVAATVKSARRWIVAPHGAMWYLPFELLIASNPMPTIANTSVTYVPCLSSVHLAYARNRPIEQSAVFLGSFFTLDKAQNQKEAQLVGDAANNTSLVLVELKNSLPSSQWLRSKIDEIICLTPQDAVENANLRVLPIDNNPKSRLGDWIGSTLKSPELVMLPGMETSIRSGKFGNGNEIFLPVCAMLYSGSRGIISRWSVGGESSSRYLQRVRTELKSSPSTSGAMRRATVSLWAEQFATANEPVLLPAGNDADLLTGGDHPLLWSGYMAIGDRVP